MKYIVSLLADILYYYTHYIVYQKKVNNFETALNFINPFMS
jgi:hypothetical protein